MMGKNNEFNNLYSTVPVIRDMEWLRVLVYLSNDA